MDLLGPFKIKGLKGERYIFSLTDRASRAIWVYSIKHKSDALDILIDFYNMIKNQFNISIKAFRLDNAKEFKSTKWALFCKARGILCEYTSPYTPAQNSIAERLNLFLLERIIAISSSKDIPYKLWPYLVQGIAHIKNRTYNPYIKMSPYEFITNKKPFVGYIKTLGSLTYVLVPKETRDKDNKKLSSKANKGILVGFESSNNYLVYIPSENKVINTRDALIKEDLFYKDDFKPEKEDFISLLEEESYDYNDLLWLKAGSNNDSNVESNNGNVDISNQEDTIIVQPEPDISTQEDTIIVQTEPESTTNSDEEELAQDMPLLPKPHNPPRNTSPIRSSLRIRGRSPINKGLNATTYNPDGYKDYGPPSISVYSLAALGYLGSLNEGDSEFDDNNPLVLLASVDSTKNTKSTIAISQNKHFDLIEPKSYKEAINSNYKENWLKSMKQELDSLKSNNT
jgi:hypothetical protein